MAAPLFFVVIGRTPTQLLTKLEKKNSRCREFLVCSSFIKITRIFDPAARSADELIEWKSRDRDVCSISRTKSSFLHPPGRLCNVAVWKVAETPQSTCLLSRCFYDTIKTCYEFVYVSLCTPKRLFHSFFSRLGSTQSVSAAKQHQSAFPGIVNIIKRGFGQQVWQLRACAIALESAGRREFSSHAITDGIRLAGCSYSVDYWLLNASVPALTSVLWIFDAVGVMRRRKELSLPLSI